MAYSIAYSIIYKYKYKYTAYHSKWICRIQHIVKYSIVYSTADDTGFIAPLPKPKRHATSNKRAPPHSKPTRRNAP